jgi:hypothetical protein
MTCRTDFARLFRISKQNRFREDSVCTEGVSHFDRIAKQATPWASRNPRKIERSAQVREILDMAA